MSHIEANKMMTESLGLTEAPIAVYYADEPIVDGYSYQNQKAHVCCISKMRMVREGTPLVIDSQNPGCGGGSYYMGFTTKMRDGFECFLSHGPDGSGERYKKTPELAKSFLQSSPSIPAPARYCIFQRLADVPDTVTPEVVVFFAQPDQISGLLWLINYGREGRDGVLSPMTAGCGSILYESRVQSASDKPKGILGMFDPSARQHIDKSLLTMSVAYKLFLEMLDNISGSFLEIGPWTRIKAR